MAQNTSTSLVANFGVDAAENEPSEVSQTLIGVNALVQPNLKIEIKCIAHFEK